MALEQATCEPSLRTEADADKLKQIVINLVDNAVKFSPPDARVCVRTKLDGAGLHIAVQDQGSGVAPEDAPRIFERFYRGGAGATVPGSGLGLAIARNLARLHGGDISVDSRPGQGSTFTLSLPATGASA